MKRKKMRMGLWACVLTAVLGVTLFSARATAVNTVGDTYHSKKGLQIEYGMLSDVEELGISEAFINIVFEQILSNTPTECSYVYKGTTYYFDPNVVRDYDEIIKRLNDMGATVTVAFLNQYREGYEYLLHTGQGKAGVADYGFNVSTTKGKNTVEAVSHFIAARYNGASGSKGLVFRYVIGNEVNDNGAYNWVGEMPIEQYVPLYYEVFKTITQAIHAENYDALTYVCLEHRWNTENSLTDYAGKDFLTRFNALATEDGIDWNVAFHAYSFPITNANPLREGFPNEEESGKKTDGGEINDTEDSPLITIKNLHVLTDFLHKPEFLNAHAKVRSVILSEQGYTSHSNLTGDDEYLQAAAIAYAYYAAESNPYIDAYILNGHVDQTGGSENMLFGLRRTNEGKVADPKPAYFVYKYLDTTDSLQASDFALATLGIEDWKYVIDGFAPERYDVMKSIDNGKLLKLTTASSVTGVKKLSDGMASYWEPSYNVSSISSYTYGPESGSDRPGEMISLGTAVANPYAPVQCVQAVQHTFTTPQNFSAKPYLGFTMSFKAKVSADDTDTLNVRVRVYSGCHIYDANANMKANEKTDFVVDLSDWAYKNAVDQISIWVSEVQKASSYDGVFMVHGFRSMSGVSGATTLENGKSTAVPFFKWRPCYTDYTYGDVDYADVFDPDDYALYNPSAVEKYGESPFLLFEDFIKNGIQNGARASVYFDVEAYKLLNKDLVSILGEETEKYYLHYINTGKAEGRMATFESAGHAPEGSVRMHRLYNPNSGEHFYTENLDEAKFLAVIGWNYEGNAWFAPKTSLTPVYRLYNPNSGEHHYTTSEGERDVLVSYGWSYEGIGWYSDDAKSAPLYRLYNPNATGAQEAGAHHYTSNISERDMLVGIGWNDEGIGWYGVN